MSNEFVEKDGKIGLIIIIVVLVLAVLGLGGYIVYDNYFKEEKVEEVKEEKEEIEVRELSASEVEEYIERVEVYNKFLYQYFLVDSEDEITNDVALFFAYRVLLMDQKDITVENVSNVLVDYFGEDHEFTLDDIECLVANDGVIYKYDSENNIYVEDEHGGHGGGVIVTSYVNYLSSKVDGDKVTLVTKNLYERPCGDTCGPANAYYGDVNDMFNKENHVAGDPNKDEELVYSDELFNSIKDKLPNVTYNFIVEESGNFYLESVSIDK